MRGGEYMERVGQRMNRANIDGGGGRSFDDTHLGRPWVSLAESHGAYSQGAEGWCRR